MTEGIKTVIYPVGDLAGAKRVYATLLGVEPVMDEPYYVQFQVGTHEVGLDPHGQSKGMTGPVVYWHVPDIKAAIAALTHSGAAEREPVSDFGGRLVASVSDPDGNWIGLIQTT